MQNFPSPFRVNFAGEVVRDVNNGYIDVYFDDDSDADAEESLWKAPRHRKSRRDFSEPSSSLPSPCRTGSMSSRGQGRREDLRCRYDQRKRDKKDEENKLSNLQQLDSILEKMGRLICCVGEDDVVSSSRHETKKMWNREWYEDVDQDVIQSRKALQQRKSRFLKDRTIALKSRKEVHRSEVGSKTMAPSTGASTFTTTKTATRSTKGCVEELDDGSSSDFTDSDSSSYSYASDSLHTTMGSQDTRESMGTEETVETLGSDEFYEEISKQSGNQKDVTCIDFSCGSVGRCVGTRAVDDNNNDNVSLISFSTNATANRYTCNVVMSVAPID